MQSKDIIGQTVIFTVNPKDPQSQQFEGEGKVCAVWGDGPRLWVAIRQEEADFMCTALATDCEWVS